MIFRKKNVISNVIYTHILFYDMSKKLFSMVFVNQKTIWIVLNDTLINTI